MSATDIVAVDSLVANEFALEINGAEATGIFTVSGLVAYQLDNELKNFVTVAKMVQRDPGNVFNTWLKDTESQGKDATRDVSIVAIDDGIETRRWTLKGAWIVSVSYSDFNSASTELVEESIVIGYDSVEHKWSTEG